MLIQFKPSCDTIYPTLPIDYMLSAAFKQNTAIFDLNFWFLLWNCFYASIISIRLMFRFIYVVDPILLSFRIVEFLSKFPALWFYLQCFPFIQQGLMIVIASIQNIVWGICWFFSLFHFFPIVSISEIQNTSVSTIERVCFIIYIQPTIIGLLIGGIALCIFILLYIGITRKK